MNQKDIEKALAYCQREYLRLIKENRREDIEAVLTLLELIEKEGAKEPSVVGLADLRCPSCHNWIPFDRLNGKMENAPKRCPECGQRFLWKEKSI